MRHFWTHAQNTENPTNQEQDLSSESNDISTVSAKNMPSNLEQDLSTNPEKEKSSDPEQQDIATDLEKDVSSDTENDMSTGAEEEDIPPIPKKHMWIYDK